MRMGYRKRMGAAALAAFGLLAAQPALVMGQGDGIDDGGLAVFGGQMSCGAAHGG